VGFAASEDATVAVCVLPGTELAFAQEVKRLPTRLWAWQASVMKHTTAIFRQINKEKIAAHHDALEFPDGVRLRAARSWGVWATALTGVRMRHAPFTEERVKNARPTRATAAMRIKTLMELRLGYWKVALLKQRFLSRALLVNTYSALGA
jgi:hypothetical protein